MEGTTPLSKKIQFQFDLPKNGIKPLVDGSVEVRVRTSRELSNTDLAELMGARGTTGWALFAAQQLRESDAQGIDLAPDFPKPEAKTPSQRLRAVLYRKWEQLGSPEAFERWYETKIETIITRIKEQLD
jgi:hypothetical protein